MLPNNETMIPNNKTICNETDSEGKVFDLRQLCLNKDRSISNISNSNSDLETSLLKSNSSSNLCKNLKIISEGKLFNEIEAQKALIFDFRTRSEFRSSSLRDISVNLPHNEISLDFLKKNNILEGELEAYGSKYIKDKIKKYKRFYIAIIMSEEKINLEYIDNYQIKNNVSDEISKPLAFYQTLINNRVRELGLYIYGFNLFRSKFPYLVHINDCNPKFFKGLNGFHGFPSIVLNDRLYVGDQRHVNNYIKILGRL